MAKKPVKKVQGQSQKEEALRLKTLAEQKFNSSDLESALNYASQAHSLCPTGTGVAEMLAAYKILDAAKSNVDDTSNPDWYRILDLEPFSHINSIKKQYKKLALVLHPDKNSLEASNDAFKLLNDAFHVLSDNIRRKEYDMKLRVSMQSAAMENGGGDIGEPEMFWTACSSCKVRHKFEKKYGGQSLVCPNCWVSFHAVHVSSEDDDSGEEERTESTRCRVVREKGEAVTKRKKTSSVNELIGKSDKKLRRSGEHQLEADKQRSKVDSSRELNPRGQNEDDDLTLAGFQMLVKRSKKPKEDKVVAKQKEGSAKEIKQDKLSVSEPAPVPVSISMNGNMEIMAVEDSDFYDFDKDRGERSFKKGQVWAMYDDDDGMPRHYGLIDEVVSVNPFEVKVVWLDLQNKEEERLVQWEKMGFHVACGRFRCFKKDTMNLVNIFSHMVNCERVAREIYWIYPTKGSVWALYNEDSTDISENTSTRHECSYDMVVLLTSYCETYGLSLAYLEKVNGCKTVFKRREIGPCAVRRLEKDDVRLLSHQIPARRLCGDEFPDNLQNCWELDPASLPPDLLSLTLL